VTELAAVGAAAVYVPFPHAVDDHQTTNARFVVDAGGGWLLPQGELSPARLAQLLQSLTREELLVRAQAAKAIEKTQATEVIVAACEELAQ
jgi:UDP-N-acetylglucosamine--N-acetylmuramyl-(pentapeptide) pyrophosphoryl-undecaprenol N-acetylglucosamine transferase